MEQATEQTLDQIHVRHLGIYRRVTREEAQLDKRILRTLYARFYHRGTSDGILAGYLATKKDDPAFQASLVRLKEWRMVEFAPAVYANARRILLTGDGQMWGEELQMNPVPETPNR